MIRVLIIEDEPPAVKRLVQMMDAIDIDLKIVDCLDTVKDSVHYLRNFHNMDLIISDIQLADGNSFEIFKEVNVQVPVIFATAYDEYTLQAFKVNSIDYLLKPFDQEDLEKALKKFESLFLQNHQPSIDLQAFISSLNQKNYKERFLVKKGKDLSIIPTEQVGYFYSEEGYVHLMHESGSKFIVEYTLDQLKDQLNPKEFFRISRKFYINHHSIKKIHSYFNSRLKLELLPPCSLDVIVSRERVSDFKKWLDS